MEVDPLAVALEVGAALDKLGVRFHLAGSLASSIHGLPRGTLDADIVADLQPGQGAQLAALIGAAFYADPEAMERAIRDRRCFNLIHLETMLKVDVFLPEASGFSRESFSRSRIEHVGIARTPVRVASPEDTILHKLLWYRASGETSSQQWNDVLGVLKVQGRAIDGEYLRRWARELGLEALLARALQAAGDE